MVEDELEWGEAKARIRGHCDGLGKRWHGFWLWIYSVHFLHQIP